MAVSQSKAPVSFHSTNDLSEGCSSLHIIALGFGIDYSGSRNALQGIVAGCLTSSCALCTANNHSSRSCPCISQNSFVFRFLAFVISRLHHDSSGVVPQSLLLPTICFSLTPTDTFFHFALSLKTHRYQFTFVHPWEAPALFIGAASLCRARRGPITAWLVSPISPVNLGLPVSFGAFVIIMSMTEGSRPSLLRVTGVPCFTITLA